MTDFATNKTIKCAPNKLKVGKRSPVSQVRRPLWFWYCPRCDMVRYSRYGGWATAMKRGLRHIARWHTDFDPPAWMRPRSLTESGVAQAVVR